MGTRAREANLILFYMVWLTTGLNATFVVLDSVGWSCLCCWFLIRCPAVWLAVRWDPGRESFWLNCTSLDCAQISLGIKQKVILETSLPAVLGLYFELNCDLSPGISDLNIEGFVSKQRSSLHRLFPAEICRAPLTLIASVETRNPWTEF